MLIIQVDNLDISNVSDIRHIDQFSEKQFESDAESQDNNDNNKCVEVKDIKNEQIIETNSFKYTSKQREEKLQQKLCF